MIGTDRVRCTAERPSTLDGIDVRSDAGDLRAHGYQAAGQILNMRLAGGVPQHGASLGHDRRHQRVLGAGHAWLIEEDVVAPELFPLQLVPIAYHDRGTQMLESQEV